MLAHVKALTVVLFATVIVFWMAGRAFPELAKGGAVGRQRWAVLLLSAAAFLAPSIWLYSMVCLLVAATWWMTAPPDDRAESAAVAWAALLLAVPNVGQALPAVGGIGNFLEVQHSRLLTLALLLPALALTRPDPRRPGLLGVGADWCVLAYMGLQLLVVFRFASFTTVIREVVIGSLDTLLPYWVFSRVFVDRARLREAMRGFVLMALVLAVLAMVESVKHWPFYDAVPEAWGIDWDMSVFLERAGLLRAKASAGHALVLGFVLVMALGFWGSVKPSGGVWAGLGYLGLAGGLAASLARGSWVGAGLLVMVQVVLGPQPVKRLLLAGFAGAAAVAVATQIPALQSFVDLLPFIGHSEGETVDYRRRLVELSVDLILQSPWLGVPGYANYLEELRQGQGIIDIVNSYISIGLTTGVLGLASFGGMFLAAIVPLLRLRGRLPAGDEGATMATQLVATMLALMSVIATTSSIVVIPQLLYMLVGMGVACARLYAPQASPAWPARPGVRGLGGHNP
ncbi:MAG: O-antigen ligase family protein [Burkholderiaceae bacterium]